MQESIERLKAALQNAEQNNHGNVAVLAGDLAYTTHDVFKKASQKYAASPNRIVYVPYSILKESIPADAATEPSYE